MQNEMPGHRQVAESAAAAWLARYERDDWDAAAEAQLQAWIEADFNHRAAWLRISHAWKQADCLRNLASTAAAGQVPSPDQLQVPLYDAAPVMRADPRPGPGGVVAVRNAPGRRRWWYGAVAAMAAAVVIAGAWLLHQPTYRTEVGALQVVPLSDGSRVTLNTNTVIKIRLTESQRRIELERGEAFFEVAKDPQRPFIVVAGGEQVQAVGTQFSVRREGGQVQVVVMEGVVKLDGPGTMQGGGGERMLRAGTVARAGDDGLVVRQQPVPEVEQLLSWRSGFLIFDGTPLATAVADFNRYNSRRIVIEDPGIANIPVGGAFRASNMDAFVRLIETDFSVVAVREGDRILLRERPQAGPER